MRLICIGKIMNWMETPFPLEMETPVSNGNSKEWTERKPSSDVWSPLRDTTKKRWSQLGLNLLFQRGEHQLHVATQCLKCGLSKLGCPEQCKIHTRLQRLRKKKKKSINILLIVFYIAYMFKMTISGIKIELNDTSS